MRKYLFGNKVIEAGRLLTAAEIKAYEKACGPLKQMTYQGKTIVAI